MNGRFFTTAAVAVATVGLSLSACSTDTAPAADGEGTKASVSKRGDLKIAYFSAGANNSYLQASIDEAKKTAKDMGADLDVFDGQFSAQVQFDQIQNALTSGKYNAFAVEPNDGNLVCDVLTKTAPEKKIIVSVFNLPICGRATKLGEKTWEPGTVTYVGGQTLDVYNDWVQSVIKENPDGGKIALISGPDLNANSICFFDAAKAFKKEDGFEVVAKQTTDYSTPKAFSAAQTISRANPDLDIVMSNFSGMTRGVVSALGGKSAKIYDFGGDKWALKNVTSGRLSQSVMMLPRDETREAIEALGDYAEGEDVPKFINLAESKDLPGTPFATKKNVADFTAQY